MRFRNLAPRASRLAPGASCLAPRASRLFFLLFALSFLCVSCHSPMAGDYGRSLLSDVQRVTLPNGLTVLSKQVPGAPVTSVWVYYRVGSRDDPPGEKGMAHLVEHMTFKGTRRFGPGAFHQVIAACGAVANGGTDLDCTDYHETLPNSALPIALEVEADRMHSCLMDPVQLEREKNVVLSELETEAEDPRQQLEKAVCKTAFTVHPYRFPIIGFPDQIRRITRAQLNSFYRTYYVPNNAVLVVVGDFNSGTLLRQIREDFGGIPPRRVPPRPVVTEPRQLHERRVIIHAPTVLPRVEVAYHVPAVPARDHEVLDLIKELLINGASSRLASVLTNRGRALDVAVNDFVQSDPYLFQITAAIPPDQSAASVENAIDRETDRLCKVRVSQRELAKAIHQKIAGFVFSYESVAAQANSIGYYDVIATDEYERRYLSQISSITPAEIQRAASRYLVASNRTAGWLLPSAGAAAPSHSGASEVTDESPGSDSPASLADSGTVIRALHSSLPTDLPHHPVTRRVLPNGLTVLIYPNHLSPSVVIDCEVDAGLADDPPGLPGVADATAMLAHLRTSRFTGWQIALALDSTGARIRSVVRSCDSRFDARCLTGDFNQTMNILADEVIYPIYDSEGLNWAQRVGSDPVHDLRDMPLATATYAMNAALYPPGSPFHGSSFGTPGNLRRMTPADLQSFHTRYYRPDRSAIAIVGDVDTESAFKLVQRYFGRWKAFGPPPPEPAPPPAREQPARIRNVLPGASESAITIGSGGLARSSPDYYAAELMSYILGGINFTGRLERDLRERQGLVYHVACDWDSEPIAGPWWISMQTAPANVNRAVASAIAEIRGMQQTLPTPGEMALLKNWITGNNAVGLDTNAEVASRLLFASGNHLPPDEPWTYPARIAAVTPAQVRAAARRYLHPDHLVISIAGP